VTDKKDSQAVKVAAGSLAALTAAWIGSRLGVVGTIAGAGIAAAATSGTTAIYEHSLSKAASKARDLRASRFRPKAGSEDTVPIRIADLAVGAVKKRQPRWRWAAIGGAVFAISIVVLTLIEAGVGHPISGGNQGTTLTGFLGGRTTGPKPTSRHRTPSTPEITTVTTAPMLIPSIPTSTSSPSTTEEPSFTTPDFSHTLIPSTTIAPPPSVVEPPEESP
jgi:hypothetical protein